MRGPGRHPRRWLVPWGHTSARVGVHDQSRDRLPLPCSHAPCVPVRPGGWDMRKVSRDRSKRAGAARVPTALARTGPASARACEPRVRARPRKGGARGRSAAGNTLWPTVTRSWPNSLALVNQVPVQLSLQPLPPTSTPAPAPIRPPNVGRLIALTCAHARPLLRGGREPGRLKVHVVVHLPGTTCGNGAQRYGFTRVLGFGN
jgi:hypothetical protein